MSYQYVNGKWEQKPDISTPTNRVEERQPLGGSKTTPPKAVTKSDNKPTTQTKREADKEFKQQEDNILSGDAKVKPNPHYKAKRTVRFEGLGSLTGLYFTEKVVHTWSKDGGYSQTLTVSRNGVGDSIKRGVVAQPTPEPPRPSVGSTRPNETALRQPVTPPQPSGRTYTIVKGDTLSGISRKFYGTSSKYMTIYNANKNIIKNPNLIYPKQVIKIP